MNHIHKIIFIPTQNTTQKHLQSFLTKQIQNILIPTPFQKHHNLKYHKTDYHEFSYHNIQRVWPCNPQDYESQPPSHPPTKT